MRSLNFWVAFWVLLPFIPHYGVHGQFVQNPTFSFSFSPPVRWTYLDRSFQIPGEAAAPTTPYPVYPGQWATQRDAQMSMENDLRSAVLRSVQRSNMFGGFPRPTVTGYTPQNCLIVTNASWTTLRKAGTYIAESGAVTLLRTVNDQDVGTPIVKQLQVRVTGLLGATIDQWRNVANQLFVMLSTEARVRFTTPINVY